MWKCTVIIFTFAVERLWERKKPKSKSVSRTNNFAYRNKLPLFRLVDKTRYLLKDIISPLHLPYHYNIMLKSPLLFNQRNIWFLLRLNHFFTITFCAHCKVKEKKAVFRRVIICVIKMCDMRWEELLNINGAAIAIWYRTGTGLAIFSHEYKYCASWCTSSTCNTFLIYRPLLLLF